MYDMSAKVKGKYLEYLDKPGKQNTVINYDKFGKGQQAQETNTKI